MKKDPSSSPRRRGRPRGGRNLATIVREIAGELVPVRDGGKAHRLPIWQAVIKRLQLKAMRGDIKADRGVDKLRAVLSPELHPEAGLLVVPGMMETREWIRREEIANRFRQPPAELSAPSKPLLAGALDQPVEQPRRKRVVSELAPGPYLRPPRLLR